MIDINVYAEVNAVLVSRIKALTLAGCVDVFDQVPEETSNVVYPHVIVCQPQLTDQVGVGDSRLLDGKIPFVVMIRDNPGTKAVSQLKDTYTQWRRQIITAFHQKRFDVLGSGTFTTAVDPKLVFDTRRTEFQGIASSFIVWCEFWDDRN